MPFGSFCIVFLHSPSPQNTPFPFFWCVVVFCGSNSHYQVISDLLVQYQAYLFGIVIVFVQFQAGFTIGIVIDLLMILICLYISST
jgi:hypothetical protein